MFHNNLVVGRRITGILSCTVASPLATVDQSDGERFTVDSILISHPFTAPSLLEWRPRTAANLSSQWAEASMNLDQVCNLWLLIHLWPFSHRLPVSFYLMFMNGPNGLLVFPTKQSQLIHTNSRYLNRQQRALHHLHILIINVTVRYC